MYMSVLSACLCVPDTQCGRGGPGNGATHGCESLCGSWELNQDPLQEQQVLSLLSHLCSPRTSTLLSSIIDKAKVSVAIHIQV